MYDGARHRARRDPGRRAAAHRHHGPRQEGRAARSRRSSSIRRSSGRRTRSPSTRKAACRSRNITRRSSGRRRCGCKYLDLDGKPQEIEADGLLATCLQHEIDHLNGVLFIDHISKLKRDRVTKKFTKAAKHGEPEAAPTTSPDTSASRSGKGSHAAAPDLHGHARFRGADADRDRRARPRDRRRLYPRAEARPARGMDLQPTPVEREARRLGIAGAHADDAAQPRGAGRVPRASAPMSRWSSPMG